MTLTNEDLISKAIAAREQAYCRYSGYSVGAAVVDDLGQLHQGCNVENASYPLGNCAKAPGAVILGNHCQLKLPESDPTKLGRPP